MSLGTGHFDIITANAFEGWALGSEEQFPTVVDVFIDGGEVGSIVADSFREDLQNEGIRDGYAHFSFKIPLNYFDGEKHEVRLFNRSIGTELTNSPQYFCFAGNTIPTFTLRRDWALARLLIHAPSDRSILQICVGQRRKVAIFSTFHKLGSFLKYHHAIIRGLISSGFVVVLVHATDVYSPGLYSLAEEGLFVFIKQNIGYDFGSWCLGYFVLSDYLDQIEEILFVNDSNLGPICEFETLLDRVRQEKSDIVGLTDSYEKGYHLQSYFIWFGPRVCKSAALPLFCAQYPFSSDKNIVIEKGELHLTKMFQEMGFSISALVPYELVASEWLSGVSSLIEDIKNLPEAYPLFSSNNIESGSYKAKMLAKLDAIISSVVAGIPLNPTHFFWDCLVERFDFPFIKRELVLLNPAEVPSYFKLSGILSRLPRKFGEQAMEVRRRYGGTKVPYYVLGVE